VADGGASLGARAARPFASLLSFATLTVLALEAAVRRRGEGARVVRDQVAKQIVFTGFDAVPLVTVLGALLGMAFVFTSVTLLPGIGGEQLIGKVLAISLVRELGPIVTAVVVIVRSATAVTTELGYMSAQGEVEALELLGVDPAKFLLWPRFAGITSAVVGLTVLFSIAAFGAGFGAAVVLNAAPSVSYLVGNLTSNLMPADLVVGFGKAFANGVIVSAIACYHGLSVRRDVTQIPPRVTRAVVGGLLYCAGTSVLISIVSL